MPVIKPNTCHLFFLFLIIVFASCKPQKIKYTKGTLSDIFELARKENKKVFILISDSKCPRCNAFGDWMDSSFATVEILNRDYISYKADVSDPEQKVAAQVLKCTAFPFPYFFNSDGRMIAFGFPKKREYDITHMDSVDVDVYKFRELFKLDISKEQYRKMIWYSLNAHLTMKTAQRNGSGLDSAFALAKKSVEVAPYPYNLYMAYSLSRRLGLYEVSHKYASGLTGSYTRYEKFIYASMMKGIGFSEDVFAGDQFMDSVNIQFDKEELVYDSLKTGTDLSFSFSFRNMRHVPLQIKKAEHSCDCIKLDWPQSAVAGNDTGSIRGIFHVTGKGPFYKEIFVHTNAVQTPMITVVLRGEIQ